MKKILINKEGLQTRVAILDNNKLNDFFVERKDNDNLTGSIYKGIIRNLEPSLQAAFVDIGAPKNAFLHYWDMIPATKDNIEGESENFEVLEIPEEPIRKPTLWSKIKDFFVSNNKKTTKSKKKKNNRPNNRNRSKSKKGPSITVDQIPKLFKVGDEIIVQVTKGPIGTKGARVTTNISLPGRELVLLPNSPMTGISKRIEDKEERSRLKSILNSIRIPNNMGVICRTVGTGKSENDFRRDVNQLIMTWQSAKDKIKSQRAPCCIYKEPELTETCLRDYLTDNVSEIITDSKSSLETINGIIKRQNNTTVTVKHHNQSLPLFKAYNLTKQIEGISNRRIELPSGGYLCIDETEALIAIDVNTGRNRTGKDLPETIMTTNLESVKEIARQLRLRNVGGIVVLDLIDMTSKQAQQTVFKALKTELLSDRAKTKVYPISALGLIEMTRQREHDSLRSTLFEACPYCQGRGLILSDVSISAEIQRKLKELFAQNHPELRVVVHSSILERLRLEDAAILANLENKAKCTLTFRADDSLHIEEYKVLDSTNNNVIYSNSAKKNEQRV